MKRAYIRPLARIGLLEIDTCILESSTLIDQGGDKPGNWEGEAKSADNEYGSIW